MSWYRTFLLLLVMSLVLLAQVLLVRAFSIVGSTQHPRHRFMTKKTSQRNLFSNKQEQETIQTQTTKPTTTAITTITSVEEYLDFLVAQDEEDQHQFCVIKFHASWCKSCQKFGVLFRRWADNTTTTTNKNTRLAQVEFGQNIHLCRALGIKKLPFVHIYHSNDGGKLLLTSFPCGPNQFHEKLERTMERLWDAAASSEEELSREIERLQKLQELDHHTNHVLTELQKNFQRGETTGESQQRNNSSSRSKLAP